MPTGRGEPNDLLSGDEFEQEFARLLSVGDHGEDTPQGDMPRYFDFNVEVRRNSRGGKDLAKRLLSDRAARMCRGWDEYLQTRAMAAASSLH